MASSHYETSRNKRIKNNIFTCSCGSEFTSKDKLGEHIRKADNESCHNCGFSERNCVCNGDDDESLYEDMY